MALVGTINPGTVTGFKNRIINGDFSVSQRGTTFTSITNRYHVDMWSQSDAGGFTANVSQQTATTTENAYFSSQNFLRYKKNNAVVSSIVIKIEDLQQFNNKTFTLSYWARSSDALVQPTVTPYTVNDGSSYNTYVTTTYVSRPTLSSTWQKYEVRYVFSDMYTYGFSGAHHLRLQIFDGSTVGTYDIAEVQLEEGSVATKFEKRPYATELALCQRYFQLAAKGTTGACYGTTAAILAFNFPVQMRTNPASGLLTGSTSSIDIIGGTQAGTLAANGSNGSPACYSFSVSGLTGRTAGIPIIYQDTNVYFSAEIA